MRSLLWVMATRLRWSTPTIQPQAVVASIPVPGAPVTKVLEAVLSVLPLDVAVPNPAFVMDAPPEHESVVADINSVLRGHGAKPAKRMEHEAFMSVAIAAYAIVLTGERRFYGNVVLTKGVIPREK